MKREPPVGEDENLEPGEKSIGYVFSQRVLNNNIQFIYKYVNDCNNH